jgi:SOS response regulatory protein OraA/RecX
VIADLMARGVGSETVSRVAAQLGTRQTEAVSLAAQRLRRRRSPGPPDDREVRRLAAALQRRGFEAADIRAALRQLAADPGD